jgi:hypothetical protein
VAFTYGRYGHLFPRSTSRQHKSWNSSALRRSRTDADAAASVQVTSVSTGLTRPRTLRVLRCAVNELPAGLVKGLLKRRCGSTAERRRSLAWTKT